MCKYWRAFRTAWNTFKFALRHERAHEQWEQTLNRAFDARVEAMLRDCLPSPHKDPKDSAVPRWWYN